MAKIHNDDPQGTSDRPSNPYASTLLASGATGDAELRQVRAVSVIFAPSGGRSLMQTPHLSREDESKLEPATLALDPSRQVDKMLRLLALRMEHGGEISNELSMFKVVSEFYFGALKARQEEQERVRAHERALLLGNLDSDKAALLADKAKELAEATAAHEGRLEGLKLTHAMELEGLKSKKEIAIAEISAASTRRTALFTLVGTVVGAAGGALTARISAKPR